MPICPTCGTGMQLAFGGAALLYYVCHGCGLSKMDIGLSHQTPLPNHPPRPTGLVCMHCNQPYAAIEHESADSVDFKCDRCGYRWAAATSAYSQSKPAPETY